MKETKQITIGNTKLAVHYVPISNLKTAAYNPRRWDAAARTQLKESISRFSVVDPIIVNAAPSRKNIIIGGAFRWTVAKELGLKEIPVVYLNIPDIEKEKELNLRLNKNTGDWDIDLLAKFNETFLADIGFSSEDLDKIFALDDIPEVFDLEKELQKLDIKNIEIQKGDVWQIGPHRICCGDSTVEADVLKLMSGEKAALCFTDEPYLLDYLHGKKKNGKAAEGFGLRRDRRYLETDSLPDNFISLWMDNVKKVAKDDFSIISYECWKNLPIMWAEMAKRWKVRNMIIWRLPNRVQGFAAKYKFFNKYDIAMVGSAGKVKLNTNTEEELFENEYQAALFATSGKPTWESYEAGKKYCPTDFVDFKASDEKNSGQGIIFGTKPVEIIIPYIKVLTKRDDLVIEPFCGSGSTIAAAHKLGRRCYAMEKSNVYAEVARKRIERLTNTKAVKII